MFSWPWLKRSRSEVKKQTGSSTGGVQQWNTPQWYPHHLQTKSAGSAMVPDGGLVSSRPSRVITQTVSLAFADRAPVPEYPASNRFTDTGPKADTSVNASTLSEHMTWPLCVLITPGMHEGKRGYRRLRVRTRRVRHPNHHPTDSTRLPVSPSPVTRHETAGSLHPLCTVDQIFIRRIHRIVIIVPSTFLRGPVVPSHPIPRKPAQGCLRHLPSRCNPEGDSPSKTWPHHIPSHRIASHPIASHRIPSSSPPSPSHARALCDSALPGDGALSRSAHRQGMPESHSPGPYALLESSFHASPNLRSHKQLPRRRDELRGASPTPQPLKQTSSHSDTNDDTTDSYAGSQNTTPLASPDALSGADTGLPPTPPSNSQDAIPEADFSPPPHADSVVSSLLSKKSTLSTPVNQRSPPTPDPSPPHTAGSMSKSFTTPERPILLAYPSSRADSFKTAREDPFTTEESSRSSTPSEEKLTPVEDDRGLGLAFELEDDDDTPRNTVLEVRPKNEARSSGSVDGDNKHIPDAEDIPDREWDTNLMRNVTIRRKRNPKPTKPPPSPSPSPQRNPDSPAPTSPEPGSTPRRSSSLRERVEASKNSPRTPAIESFARQIGWPTEGEDTAADTSAGAEEKRFSTSSMSSSVVEAMVIVTPPQRRRALRHSGRNLAYVRHTSSPMEYSSRNHSSRTSYRSDEVPLHRLVHKRAAISDKTNRMSVDAATLSDRSASTLSITKQRQDSAAATLAHQEMVRSVLQPAAEIMSRSNSVRQAPVKSHHKRISSAPEPTLKRESVSPDLRSLVASPDKNNLHGKRNGPSRLAYTEVASPTSAHFEEVSSPESPLQTSPAAQRLRAPRSPINMNKSLPEIPADSSPNEDHIVQNDDGDEKRPSSTLHDQVRILLSEQENSPSPPKAAEASRSPDSSKQRTSSADTATTIRRGSLTIRGRSEERRRSSHSQDGSSTSRDKPWPSLDRTLSEEIPRTSHEWHSFHTDGHGRVSFDRLTSKTEEHAMARHMYAQTTPFSQFSDTPIEVSEATALSRSSTQAQIVGEAQFASSSPQEEAPPTPPFVDAIESPRQLVQPTLTFEPSTPPMQIQLPAPGAVDSPLRNPRPPPEPPVIKFIPPTPAEELERQLVPGPPKHSESHPQRRLSLKQRARRYSDNLISPILARASSVRRRRMSESHAGHGHPQVPTVNDSDNALHPFWRPRGFWDGFDDTDSDSDDFLPRGGDTSDVEDDEPEPESPRKLGQLGRRLTNGWRNSGRGGGSFHIGNSLGVERAGTNKRHPHISLPSRRLTPTGPLRRLSRKPSAPKILLQPPTLPLGPHTQRIDKRGSPSSMRSSGSIERASRRDTWRKGKKIPGLKGVQVQYIGLSGVKERFRERKAEKRRDELRRSIGGRWYVEPPGSNVV
ncbi:hypothetical protein CC80DRAFT_505943 [Byssothecium circinans]|uniref:Uncharacterized protein n=1 Tax=Byssothecium circinans TaxID=147558 RepID=A0A6A5U1S5_9PLEO|nr:hypothetical protein CC80DRAFT_505943 [Byssothecium circinans]